MFERIAAKKHKDVLIPFSISSMSLELPHSIEKIGVFCAFLWPDNLEVN